MGKKQKKQWRKCLPDIEDEIIKAKQLKEIEESSFSLQTKPKAAEVKCSTVPRTAWKRQVTVVNRETPDVWADGYAGAATTVTKHERKRLEALRQERANRPRELDHSGLSYNPPAEAHAALLELLATDEMAKIARTKRYRTRDSVAAPTDDAAETTPHNYSDEIDEQSPQSTAAAAAPTKSKRLTTKQRRQRLANEKAALHRQKARSKAKSDAHELRNLPKLRRQIRDVAKAHRERRERDKLRQSERDAQRVTSAQLALVPFQLPSEIAPSLMKVQPPEGDLLAAMEKRLKAKMFSVRGTGIAEKQKRRPTRKLTKMVRKKGLV